jgi:hypothetical protein
LHPRRSACSTVQVISHVTRCWPRRAIRYCIPISTQNGFVCTIQMKTCCREKLEGDTSGGLFQIGKRFGCLAPYFGWKAGRAIFNESWQVEPRFSRDAVERKYSKLGSKNRQGQHLNAVEVWSVTSALGTCDCLVHDPADGVRAPPALGAAAEAAIDLASRCRRSLGGDRAHVVVAQYVARTDDHGGPSFPTRFSSLCNYRHSGGLTA